jgi:hypothetical protein
MIGRTRKMRRVRFQIDFYLLRKGREGRATGLGGSVCPGRQLLEMKAIETLSCREREIATRTGRGLKGER